LAPNKADQFPELPNFQTQILYEKQKKGAPMGIKNTLGVHSHSFFNIYLYMCIYYYRSEERVMKKQTRIDSNTDVSAIMKCTWISQDRCEAHTH